MTNQLTIKPNFIQYTLAWTVHALTASGAFFGLLTLYEIYKHHFISALWLMAITVIIDAIDGTLARKVHIKTVLPKIDGALLDNMVDYLNYTITPVFFLLVAPKMLPSSIALVVSFAIVITSSYQFCQADAKTPDHFFKGFPCYWNFAIFYMFIFQSSPMINVVILAVLCVLIFIPIKYVYPSRLDYLTPFVTLKIIMHLCSILYAFSSALLLWHYPEKKTLWLGLSLGYVILYLVLSIYRTCWPMIVKKIISHKK